MADISRFSKALLTYAEQINSIEPLKRERDAIFAKLQTGGGKELVNATVEGKTFGWQLSMSLAEKFAAIVEAIDQWENVAGGSCVTHPDYSQL